MSRGGTMEVFAFEPVGYEGRLVRIEVDLRRGIPAVDVVGLAAGAVRESRERVRAAIRNSGYEFPAERILISLSPADIPKAGSSYDLPIGVKILSAAGALPECSQKLLVLGELTLDGCVVPSQGVLPAALLGLRNGIDHCIVPAENMIEIRRLDSMKGYPLSRLADLPAVLLDLGRGIPHKGIAPRVSPSESGNRIIGLDFSDYRGNPRVVRALGIAAAGRHNILLFGPPGSGKTMAALRFPSFLPDLDESGALEVASIWSLHGARYGEGATYRRPPFAAPHHSATLEGIIGGGTPLKPGAASLAHRGVLFLDETPEFRRDVLQALREPLECGYVTVDRAGRSARYPADFQLILAANPCPCGNLGNPGRTCLCSPVEIQQYWKRLGGPLLDRIDMRIPVAPSSVSSIVSSGCTEFPGLKAQVDRAVAIQKTRTVNPASCCNARLPPGEVLRACSLSAEAERYFAGRVDELGCSLRACHSILKVARTIADMEGSPEIGIRQLEEAFSYRQYGDGDVYWPF